MAQLTFDHVFNMLAEPAYSDRCRRKKQLRQRKSPSGNYQVDEDVWARHPSGNIMYIASVISVDKYHRTCNVAFIDDEQAFNLLVSHLRHITREDIKRNRYVDMVMAGLNAQVSMRLIHMTVMVNYSRFNSLVHQTMFSTIP